MADSKHDLTASQIAEKLKVSKPTVNRILKELVESKTVHYAVGERNTRYYDPDILTLVDAKIKRPKSERLKRDDSFMNQLIDSQNARISELTKENDRLSTELEQKNKRYDQVVNVLMKLGVDPDTIEHGVKPVMIETPKKVQHKKAWWHFW